MILKIEIDKFPEKLQEKIKINEADFRENLIYNKNIDIVFRGVKYNKEKTKIMKEDFVANIYKKGRPSLAENNSKIGLTDFSCSVFTSLDDFHLYTSFPNKNKAVAKGNLKVEHGPYKLSKKTTHIDWFLYKDSDPSKDFIICETIDDYNKENRGNNYE